LIKTTWELYRRNFALYVGYSAWILLPTAALFLLDATIGENAGFGLAIALNVILIIVAAWVAIVMTQLTAGIVTGQKIKLEKISESSLQRLSPVVWVALIVSLVELAGFVVLIIPGIVFSIWYGFAQIDTALGFHRGIASLAASRELVRGRFWSVLGRLWGGMLSFGVIYIILSYAVVAMIELVTSGTVTLFSDSPSLAAQMFSSIFDSIAMPIFVIYPTLLYLDLKKGMSVGTPTEDVKA